MTEYHKHGSLFDYLSTHALSPSQMLTMTISIVTGLAHLHMEIIGTQGTVVEPTLWLLQKKW